MTNTHCPSSKHAQDATPARDATPYTKDSAVRADQDSPSQKTSHASRDTLAKPMMIRSRSTFFLCNCMEKPCIDHASYEQANPTAHATSSNVNADAPSTQSDHSNAAQEHGANTPKKTTTGLSNTTPWTIKIRKLYTNGAGICAVGA